MLERFRDHFSGRKPVTEDPAVELRRDSRKSVLLRATIYPIDVYNDVIIRDLSQTGIMGESDIELIIGQTLHLSVDEKTFQSGTVRWTRGRRFGLHFDDPLTLFGGENVEVEHGAAEGQRPRSRRVNLDIAARLSAGRPPRPAVVRNLSRSGMQLETCTGLGQGQRLLVKINQNPPIHGRVQWAEGMRIGLKSFEPISLLKLIYSCE
jgi:PilZ domain